MALEQSISQ